MEKFYNISNTGDNIINTLKDKKSLKEEIVKFKYNIQKYLLIDSIHIYIYDPNSDLLILKGENEEIKYSNNSNLDKKYIFDKKIEILLSFISKALGSMCIYYNYIK